MHWYYCLLVQIRKTKTNLPLIVPPHPPTEWALMIKSIPNIQIWFQNLRGLPLVTKWYQENGGDTTRKYTELRLQSVPFGYRGGEACVFSTPKLRQEVSSTNSWDFLHFPSSLTCEGLRVRDWTCHILVPTQWKHTNNHIKSHHLMTPKNKMFL